MGCRSCRQRREEFKAKLLQQQQQSPLVNVNMLSNVIGTNISTNTTTTSMQDAKSIERSIKELTKEIKRDEKNIALLSIKRNNDMKILRERQEALRRLQS